MVFAATAIVLILEGRRRDCSAARFGGSLVPTYHSLLSHVHEANARHMLEFEDEDEIDPKIRKRKVA